MMPNRTRLPSSEESAASAVADSVARTAMNVPSRTAPAPRNASTTGSQSFRRWTKATLSRPASEDAQVASRIGRKTRVGSGGTLLHAVHEDRHRQQGQRRGVHDQEQDLRVACGFRFGVQRLQFAHRAQPDRRGRIVEAEAVGGEVQGDQANGRMAARHLGHQACEQGAEPARKDADQSGLFGDVQEAQPQAQACRTAGPSLQPIAAPCRTGWRPWRRTRSLRRRSASAPVRQRWQSGKSRARVC